MINTLISMTVEVLSEEEHISQAKGRMITKALNMYFVRGLTVEYCELFFTCAANEYGLTIDQAREARSVFLVDLNNAITDMKGDAA